MKPKFDRRSLYKIKQFVKDYYRSEVMSLFKYFMISNEDYSLIENKYLSLLDGDCNGLSVTKLLTHLNLPNLSFYENYLINVSVDNCFIDFNQFIKLVLMFCILPINHIIENTYMYFECSNSENNDIINSFPTDNFLGLYTIGDINSDLSDSIKSDLKNFNGKFKLLIASKVKDPRYRKVFRPFEILQQAITKMLFNSRNIESIKYRMNHYSELYDYYQVHNKQLPLTLCQKVENYIYDLPNRNNFNYIMSPTEREIFKFPYLFIKKLEVKKYLSFKEKLLYEKQNNKFGKRSIRSIRSLTSTVSSNRSYQ